MQGYELCFSSIIRILHSFMMLGTIDIILFISSFIMYYALYHGKKHYDSSSESSSAMPTVIALVV